MTIRLICGRDDLLRSRKNLRNAFLHRLQKRVHAALDLLAKERNLLLYRDVLFDDTGQIMDGRSECSGEIGIGVLNLRYLRLNMGREIMDTGL